MMRFLAILALVTLSVPLWGQDKKEDKKPVKPKVDKAKINSLVDKLGHSNKGVRVRAANALGRIGTPAIPPLKIKLSSPSWLVRYYACYSLYKMGSKAAPATDALIKRLKDSDLRVRCLAARAISAIGPKAVKAVPALAQGLYERDYRIRSYFAYALGEIGRDSPAAKVALIKALKDKNPAIRKIAIRSLGKLKAEEAAPALTAMFNNQNKSTQVLILQSVKEIQSPKALPLLLKILGEKDSPHRKLATETLQAIGPQATSHLIAILKGKNTALQPTAAHILGTFPKPTSAVEKALLQGLRHQDYKVREECIRALGNLGCEKAIPGIIKGLSDNWYVQDRAVEALVKLGRPTLGPLLIALSKASKKQEKAIYKTLQKMGTKAIPAAIEVATSGTSPGVQKGLAMWVEKAGLKALAPLLKSLRSEKPVIQVVAATHLGNMKKSANLAAPALLKVVEKGDTRVVTAATKALEKLKPHVNGGLKKKIDDLSKKKAPTPKEPKPEEKKPEEG